MFTMILLFCVILLVREMMEQGQDPLAALRPEEIQLRASAAAPEEEPSLGMRDIILYFSSQDGQLLAPEIRSMDFTNSTLENCRRALKLLIEGPREILTPVMPPATQINAMYLLEDGELVVDFSRELQGEPSRFRSASTESLLVFSVVNTLTQSALQAPGGAQVTRVRFLIESIRPQETFPAHLDLSQPLQADPNWVEPIQERTANAA
jgi:hypothetical protein